MCRCAAFINWQLCRHLHCAVFNAWQLWQCVCITSSALFLHTCYHSCEWATIGVCIQCSGKSPQQTLLAVQTQGDPYVTVQLSASLTTGEQIQLSQPLQVPTSPGPTCSLLNFDSNKHFSLDMQVALRSNLAFISGFSVDAKPAWPQCNGRDIEGSLIWMSGHIARSAVR